MFNARRMADCAKKRGRDADSYSYPDSVLFPPAYLPGFQPSMQVSGWVGIHSSSVLWTQSIVEKNDCNCLESNALPANFSWQQLSNILCQVHCSATVHHNGNFRVNHAETQQILPDAAHEIGSWNTQAQISFTIHMLIILYQGQSVSLQQITTSVVSTISMTLFGLEMQCISVVEMLIACLEQDCSFLLF